MIRKFNELTKGQQKYVDQMTRKLLVEWCFEELSPMKYATFLKDDDHNENALYIEYAQHKKWVSADGDKVLAAGWNTASAFLRR